MVKQPKIEQKTILISIGIIAVAIVASAFILSGGKIQPTTTPTTTTTLKKLVSSDLEIMSAEWDYASCRTNHGTMIVYIKCPYSPPEQTLRCQVYVDGKLSGYGSANVAGDIGLQDCRGGYVYAIEQWDEEEKAWFTYANKTHTIKVCCSYVMPEGYDIENEVCQTTILDAYCTLTTTTTT